MLELFEPFLVTGIPVPSSGDLHFDEEEATEALNGYLSLWHPVVLRSCSSLPRWIRPDEAPAHGNSSSPALLVTCGHVGMPSLLPDNSCLINAAPAESIRRRILDTQVLQYDGMVRKNDGKYPAIGLGVLIIDALFEAQNHSNLLQRDQVLASLRSALVARDGDNHAAELESLKEAANYLVVARESLSSSNGHVLDLTLVPENSTTVPESPAFNSGLTCSMAVSGVFLERLESTNPKALESLRDDISAGRREFIGGCYINRPEWGLSLSSIAWNLDKGQEIAKRTLGQILKIHFRSHSLPVPSLPGLLRHFGMAYQVLPANRHPDEYPPSRASLVSWSWGDAMGLESFAGKPLNPASNRDMLHVARRFSGSISTDYTPVLVFQHDGTSKSCDAYTDWCALGSLAPVLGGWTDFAAMFRGVSPGDYWNESSGSEFGRVDCPPQSPTRLEQRRLLDAAMVHDALLSVLGADNSGQSTSPQAESDFEAGNNATTSCQTLAESSGKQLADRLLRSGEPGRMGWLILNPCAFNRRVIVDIEGQNPLQIQGPVLASQAGENGPAKAVVEVPGLGFAWIPRQGTPGTVAPRQRLHLADERGTRNEFLEAEFDPATGGLRGLKDLRHRVARLQQAIHIAKGSAMLAKSIRVVCRGPARGELEVVGNFVDFQGAQIGTFTQRIRTWIGRPVLELDVDVHIDATAADAFPSMRFSWRDPATELRIGCLGQSMRLQGETHVETEYLHMVNGAHATTIISPGNLRLRRRGPRGVELDMLAAGEGHFRARLGLAVDRDYPHLLARGWQSPVTVIAVDRGPPSIGASGWLAHQDAPAIQLERLRCTEKGQVNLIRAMAVECLDEGTSASLQLARSATKVFQFDEMEETPRELTEADGAVPFDVRRRGITSLIIESAS